VVNREVMVPLRSPPRLDSAILGFIIGLWPIYLACPLNFNLITVKPCTLFWF